MTPLPGPAPSSFLTEDGFVVRRVLCPRSFGNIVQDAWVDFRETWVRAYFLVAAFFLVPIMIFAMSFTLEPGLVSKIVAAIALLFFVASLPIVRLGLVSFAHNARLGQRPGVGTVVREAATEYWKLWGALLIVLVAIHVPYYLIRAMLPNVLLLLPLLLIRLFLMLRIYFLNPVILLENDSVLGSIEESWRLTGGPLLWKFIRRCLCILVISGFVALGFLILWTCILYVTHSIPTAIKGLSQEAQKALLRQAIPTLLYTALVPFLLAIPLLIFFEYVIFEMYLDHRVRRGERLNEAVTQSA